MLGATVDRTDARRGRAARTWQPASVAGGTPGGADAALAADYRSRSVTIGNRVRASLPGDRTVEGVAADVDDLGRLRIDTGDEVVTVSAGDITHLRPANP